MQRVERGALIKWAYNQSMRFNLLFLILASLCFSSPARAGVTGDKELFPLLIKAFTENWDAVHTWRGEATIEQTDDWHSPAETLANSRKADVKFVFDKQAGSVRWEIDYSSITSQKVDQPTYRTRGMLKGDLVYDMNSNEAVKPKGRPGLLHIRSTQGQKMPVEASCDRFYPMAHLSQINTDTPRWLGYYLEDADKLDQNEYSIKREGSLVTFSIGSATTVLNRYTFDTSKGGNIVEAYFKETTQETTIKSEYAKVGDLYVPSKVETNTVAEYPTHGRKSHGVVTFTKNLLNEELPADEFTLDKMGALPGDTIFNHITGQYDKYKKGGR